MSRPAIIRSMTYDWTDFVGTSGYPMVGKPNGLCWYSPHEEAGFPLRVFAVLSYDGRGYLQGACMVFPDGTPVDKPGNVSTIVRPNVRRKGIATMLLATMDARFPIDWTAQTYTPQGLALVESFRHPSSDLTS